MPISIAGPVIFGGGWAVAAIAGLALGETLDVVKVTGIALVFGGITLLSLASR